MAEGKLDELTDLSKLLPAASKVVVANGIEVCLLGLAVKRVALGVNDLGLVVERRKNLVTYSVRSNNLMVSGERRLSHLTYTVRGWVDLDNLEVDCAHTTTDLENVAWGISRAQADTYPCGLGGTPRGSRA